MCEKEEGIENAPKCFNLLSKTHLKIGEVFIIFFFPKSFQMRFPWGNEKEYEERNFSRQKTSRIWALFEGFRSLLHLIKRSLQLEIFGINKHRKFNFEELKVIGIHPWRIEFPLKIFTKSSEKTEMFTLEERDWDFLAENRK